MKACLALAALLLAATPALGADSFLRSRSSVLSVAPTTSLGQVEWADHNRYNGGGNNAPTRGPASSSQMSRNAKNRAMCEKIEPGQRYMIKNSVHDWDDRVVTVVDKFDDCSVRVRVEKDTTTEVGSRRLGSPDRSDTAFVRFKNLAASLAPEVDCVKSHGVDICKNDFVFYPARTSSMELPEAPVRYAFAHGVVVVRDGANFVLDADQVGKSVACSPQKESVCVGDYVYAEGFRVDRHFNFEGPVRKAYTHGVVVVEADKLWKFPIDVSAVKKRIASQDGIDDPAVISTRNSRGKDLPFNVTPEIEPFEPNEADRVRSVR